MSASVAEIVADVRARGDDALREWSLRLDGAEPALAAQEPGLPEEAVLALASRVRRWHEAQRPADVRLEVEPGVELERRWVPLASIGIYANASDWNTITGTTTAFAALPYWQPGAATKTNAQSFCGRTGVTGGPVTLSQYLAGGLDGDLRC